MAEITITKDNFEEEVINSDVPVLLDFWAAWCGPCKMISPIIAELAEEYDGKLKVGKVNVDDENELALAFKITSIPLVVIIKANEVADSIVGYRPKIDFVEMIERNL